MHTKENFAREPNDTASQVELNWQWRIDALVRGDCREDDFIVELSSLWKAAPDSARDVIALLAQQFRRGKMPVDLFRSMESKIVQSGLGAVDYDLTINLDLALATQRDVPNHTSHVLTSPGLGDQTHTDTSAAQATPLRTPQARIQDRSASSIPDIGHVLRNRYVLESRLGSGGMGTVFKAMDRYRCDLTEDNRHVAVKFLYEEPDNRSEVLSNLRREFFCAQALSHRSIVKVYELDLDDDVAFFTMELLQGELLSSVLERSRSIAISRSYAWEIIREIGDGLAHAHARNVVHGDLKPQNIMITNSGELRILDFGASHAPARQRSNADGARKSTINVTPAYACCQLLEGQQADPRDDLYALACVSYELLAGEHPFQGRRSTEARDLGLLARRPPGLTRQQWQTLALGLSWRREGRSISVRDWIAKVDPRRAAARPLGSLLARKFERSFPLMVRASGAIALFAILLAGLTVWMLFNRVSLESRMAGNFAGPSTAANALPNADPVTPYQNLLLDRKLLAGSASMGPPLPDILSGERPTLQKVTFATTTKSDAAHTGLHKEKLNKISISADVRTIGSRDNFAEIHVRRFSGFDGDSTFVWWTEPSSAKPGIDYVPQDPMIRLMPKGSHLASLFIKIIPNASRKHSATFYVTIADPGNDALGHLARTAILLPPSK